MAVKYGLTFAAVGWSDIPDAVGLRAIAHAPIDSFFLNGLAPIGSARTLPKLRGSRSRITDYDDYFALQRWLREAFTAPPLDVEFHIWNTVSAERRAPTPSP